MLKRLNSFLFGLVLVCVVTSCASLQSPSSTNPRVMHVVICWLKDPKDLHARNDLIETAKSFSAIPGVLDVKAGEVLSGKRPMVDSSFDVAVTIYFKNEQALRDYEQHPIHQRAVQEKLLPLAKKTTCCFIYPTT